MKSSIAFLLLVMFSGTSPSRLYAQATSAPGGPPRSPQEPKTLVVAWNVPFTRS